MILRLRRLLFGRRAARAATIGSAIAGANRVSAVGSLAPPEGPFDAPPDEPVTLAEVPWELRDDKGAAEPR